MPTLSFKVSATEARAIRRSARLTKKTLSEYLRAAALPVARPKAKDYQTRIDPATGIPVTIPPPSVAPVTSALVREQLADFP